jgi:hypothetical protein
MTYRERRAARADRLRGWADTRQTNAAAALATGDKYRGDTAFNTQPGHIPERARLIARTDRAFESLAKAASMDRRADEIERQADHAIYSDDADAIERLTEKIARLEAEREAMKTANAAFRKVAKDKLKAEPSAYQRDLMMPHQGYESQNLSGNISRLRNRLRLLTGTTRSRAILADGTLGPLTTQAERDAAGQAPPTMPVGATATERAGLTVAAGMTTPSRPGKAPRPVWTVRGNFATHRALLLELGGSWYGGSFSFWDDPSAGLEAALTEAEAAS